MRNTIIKAGLLAAAVMAAATLTASAQAPSGSGDHPKLPQGEGRDLMIKVCGTCHDPDSAADQDLDASGWKDLVQQMASMGADATDDQLTQITAYLTKAFPPSK